MIPDLREDLCLLDRVNAQIGFQLVVWIQVFFFVASLFADHLEQMGEHCCLVHTRRGNRSHRRRRQNTLCSRLRGQDLARRAVASHLAA